MQNAPCAVTLPGCGNSTRSHEKVPSAAMRRYKNCLPPTHLMPAGKGNLVRITNPERRRGQRAGKLQEKALEKLGSREDTADFLERIRKEKPRYGADQMRAIVTTLETYEGMDAIGKALDYCIEQALYSAGDFRMAVEYFAQTDRPEPEKSAKAPVPGKYRCLRPQVRSMEEYIQAAEG